MIESLIPSTAERVVAIHSSVAVLLPAAVESMHYDYIHERAGDLRKWQQGAL